MSGKEIANIYGCKSSNSVRQILKVKGFLRNQSEASSLAVKNGKKVKAIEKLIMSARTINKFNPKKAHHGKDHPLWKKDRTTLKKIRMQAEEKWFFKEIIRERGYKCELTDKKGTVSVHHVKPVWKYPELRFVKENVVVVLKKIHKYFHRIYGFKSDENDWYNFLNKKEYVTIQI